MGNERGNGAALLPIGVFLVIFLGSGIITGDFYAMPAIVAFLIAGVLWCRNSSRRSGEYGKFRPFHFAGEGSSCGIICDRMFYICVHGNFNGNNCSIGADCSGD